MFALEEQDLESVEEKVFALEEQDLESVEEKVFAMQGFYPEGEVSKNLDVFPKKPFERVATFFKDYFDEGNASSLSNPSTSKGEVVQNRPALGQPFVAPPPPPSIKHLRRWLPSSTDQMPNAS